MILLLFFSQGLRSGLYLSSTVGAQKQRCKPVNSYQFISYTGFRVALFIASLCIRVNHLQDRLRDLVHILFREGGVGETRERVALMP